MPSRRKMCAKLFMTVVVPAPEDPVTAIMGCLMDTQCSPELIHRRTQRSQQCLRPEQRAFVEERRGERPVRAAFVFGVVALDPFDLVARAEDQRNALMERLRPHLHEALVTGRRPTPRLLHERSEEHTSELQSRLHLVCRLLLENKKT